MPWAPPRAVFFIIREQKAGHILVYIRAKSSKGDKYLYLVRSVWDKEKSTSRQEIIKYLGKASSVRAEDIPPDYRENPRIAAFLEANSGGVENAAEGARGRLLQFLVQGDLGGAVRVYTECSACCTLAAFYTGVLGPVMYRIGELWVDGKLGIGEEHVASNVARELVVSVSRKGRRRGRQARVLICTPSGEEHTLCCHVLQSFLQSRGFDVSNISPSAPSETVLHHIEKERPDVVMISITLGENVPAGQRLVSCITSSSDVPVVVGGQQVFEGGHKFPGAVTCSEPLERVPGLVRGLLKAQN